MKKKWLAALIIYIALVAACIVIVYAVPSVKGMLEKTYITEYGKIDITDKVSAYIVRDETVYVASHDAEVERVAETGVLLNARTGIVKLTPILSDEEEALKEAGPDADQATAEAAAEANEGEADNISRKYAKAIENLNGNWVSTENGKSKQAGYISYSIDGGEAKYSTDNIGNLSQADYEALRKLRTIETPDRKCGKGEPVFKVIHNSKWYLVFYIDNKAGEKYYEGRTVSIDVAGKKVPVKVAQVQTGEATTKVTLSCKTFFEDFFKERSLDTVITVASAEGLVLQDSSIVMKGDQPGVFVKNKLGEHKFKPISIKADDGKRCVVYSDIFVDAEGNYVETLSTYDEIVAEPSEEEIEELQKQAAIEAAEKAEREAAEKAAAEKAAADQAAAEQAAAEKAAAEQAAAEQAAAEQAAAAQAAAQGEQQPAPDGSTEQASPEGSGEG